MATQPKLPEPHFTEGPWRFNGNWLEPVDYGADDLILTYTSGDDGLHGTEADKALIAAAPDLYTALIELRWVGSNLLDRKKARAKADAALAKARGETL